ncbi:MAG: methylmalonyl Co-A mutase-associated GTPase MeaB [Prevotellaceae bacterium]|jgi:LAO/AO transport system kinase|nr:methylmalonyl Co-A mutase-associated GTPase MeaB [Prevotellaceae bacterium]
MYHHHIEDDTHYPGLSVSKGIATPPMRNPYKKTFKHRPQYTTADFVQGILDGDRTVLSLAVTLIESANPVHYAQAQEVVEQCLPYAGKSLRLGITGVPGAGKSTFIDTLGSAIVTSGKRLAVLAIDPSSGRSKGSILGDKTRMNVLSVSENAFVRPSPSAGSLGGVARKTRETIVLCEAAGFDTVFVETVGVGQSETAVHSMVDFFLLIQLAGTGDELQGIKRGIMEMADGIAINKCDGSNIDKANLAKNQFQNALHLFPMPESGWLPQVITCSAYERTNIDKVWKMIMDYATFTQENGYFNRKRRAQGKYWMYETIDEQLRNSFYRNMTIEKMLKKLEHQLDKNEISSFAAAHKLLDVYFDIKSNKEDER